MRNASLSRSNDTGQREGNVLHYRECVEEREVLEDHADPEAPGCRRAGDAHRPALPANLARARLESAVDDLDQRGLARAVLSEQGVNCAGAQRK